MRDLPTGVPAIEVLSAHKTYPNGTVALLPALFLGAASTVPLITSYPGFALREDASRVLREDSSLVAREV